MESRTIHVDLVESDCAEFLDFHSKTRFKQGRVWRPRRLLLLLVINFVLFVAAQSVGGGPWTVVALEVFQFVLAGVTCGIIFLILLQWAAKFTIGPTQARMRREFALANAGKVTLTFTDEGVTESRQLSDSMLYWDAVGKVVCGESSIYIYTTEHSAFIVPKRCFDSDPAFVEFFNSARAAREKFNTDRPKQVSKVPPPDSIGRHPEARGTIEVEATDDDVAEFFVFHFQREMGRVPRMRRWRPVLILCLVLAVLITILLMLVPDRRVLAKSLMETLPHPPPVFLCLFLFVWVVLYVLLRPYRLNLKILKWSMLKRIRRSPNGTLAGKKTFVLQEDGIREVSENSESFVNWNSIHDIVSAASAIYIYNTPQSGFVVPKRSFPSGVQCEEFFNRAKGFWEASRSAARRG